MVEAAVGKGVIETDTAVYDREGAPVLGIALGRTADGSRFLADLPLQTQLLESFVASEQVGCEGRLLRREGKTIFDPAQPAGSILHEQVVRVEAFSDSGVLRPICEEARTTPT